MVAFFVEFHREAVAQEHVARVVGEHGFDFFAARHRELASGVTDLMASASARRVR